MITVKEYFNQAFTLDRILKATRTQLAELKERRFCVSAIRYDNDKVQSRLNHESFNALSDLYMDLEQKYIDDEKRLMQLKLEMKSHIDRLDDPVHRLIMTERYMNTKTFEQIALDNNYSCYHVVHRLHPAALKKAKQVMECYCQCVVQ